MLRSGCMSHHRRGNGEQDDTPTPRWRQVDFAAMPTEQALGIIHAALTELDDRTRKTHVLAATCAARTASIKDGLERQEREEIVFRVDVMKAFAKVERRMDRVAESAAEAKGAAERSGSHPQIVVLDKTKGDSEAPLSPLKEWAKRNKRAAAVIGVLLTVAGILAELARQLP